jgi:hypothetical protein
MALGKNRAQPRRQTASPVEVAEQRLARVAAGVEAVELGIERIGQVASAARRIERVGSPIERGSMFLHELVPGCFVAGLAGARQGEIFQPERLQVAGELVPIGRCGGERSRRAPFERLGKGAEVNVPSLGLRLAMQPRRQRTVHESRWHLFFLSSYRAVTSAAARKFKPGTQRRPCKIDL